MMVISIVIGALGTVTKGLVKRLEDLKIRTRVETIQTTAMLRPTWKEFWRLKETYCHSNSSERPSADAGVKNSPRSSIITSYSHKETEQKYKTWIVNEARRTNKETTITIENTKKGKIHWVSMEGKEQKKTTADKIEINKSKDIGERKEAQKISGQRQTIQTKQEIPK